MKYRISEVYIKKRKRVPLYCVLWGLIVGSIFIFSDSLPLYLGIAMAIGIASLTGGANWLGAKRENEFFKNHEVEIVGQDLISTNLGLKTTLNLPSIHKLILNKKRKVIDSIIIERVKGQKEKLPPYEDLNGLAENIIKIVPTKKVKVRGWFHL